MYKPGLEGSLASLLSYASRLELLAKLDPPIEIEVLVSHWPSKTPLGLMSLSGIDFTNSKAEFSLLFFRGRGTRSMCEGICWALNTIFNELMMEKLIFYVLTSNSDVDRMLSKYNLTKECVLIREIALNNGQRMDVNRYSLFKDEWEKGGLKLKLNSLFKHSS